MTDYKLDIEFAYGLTIGERTGGDRIRAFERIRRLGDSPTSNNPENWRYSLLDRVEEAVPGSKAIYQSNFWTLLTNTDVTIRNTHVLVHSCFNTLGLWRDDNSLEFAPLGNYINCLDDVIAAYELNLDLMALIGALYREAYLVGALDVAWKLSARFTALLNDFRHRISLPDKLSYDFLVLAEERVLHWMSQSAEYNELYGDYPMSVVSNPIFAYE